MRLSHCVSAGLLLLAAFACVPPAVANNDDAVQIRLTNCRQSSDYAGISRCTGAIDGTTNQRWSAAGMSTTNNDPHPFWEAQADQVTHFKRIRIFNRQDCCPERLNNFVIKIDGHECARYHSTTSFSIKTFDCDREGRVVRIESTIQTHLTLAEVQVFGVVVEQTTPTPMLKLSNCDQSSDYLGSHKCTAAIDGNTKQMWGQAVLATTNTDLRPWWEAKMEAPALIKQVKIFNRQDCCPERLANFVIRVDGKVCAEYNSGPFSVWTFDCNRAGRTVHIESRISTHLTIAEVQVFGDILPRDQWHLHPEQVTLKNCRQSSDYAGISRCTGAIDGTTNQRWTATGMSTTNNDLHPFWEAQAEKTTHFKRIRIFNRQDCCPERLNNFVIKIDGHECARYHSTTWFAVKSFDCGRVGKVLRIESTVQTHLTLAEVQVFGSVRATPTKYTMLKLSNCDQSSDYLGSHKCTAAIDGNTKQMWGQAVLATTNTDLRPWWEAKMEAPALIKQVKIFNRQDCCPERLANFVIRVDGKVCAEYNSGPFSVWTFDCNRAGRTVHIESRISTHLTIAEVQVFGDILPRDQWHLHPEQVTLKNCRQSSDYAGISRCTGAIDGTTNQRWTATGMSTTNNDLHPFWEAQAEKTTHFKRIRIFNRQDCCPERLNNFVIKIDGHECARYHSTTWFAVKSFDCGRVGKVLRIESTVQTHLTLAEVQVFGSVRATLSTFGMLKLSNCAQSSDYVASHKCTAAIDGSTKQMWSTATMATTQIDPRPWWEARTEAPAMIKRVKIFNRQDCCPERLGNFVIKVDGKVCAEYNSGPFSVWTFDCNRAGRIVHIESRIATHLTLAEVQVFGDILPRDQWHLYPEQLTLKNCRQSSDYAGISRCTGAIDGTTNQRWTATGMSTTNNDPHPFWEAQADQVTHFQTIRIFNRQDCCPERLNNFVIKIDGHECARYHSTTSFVVKSFKCDKVGKVLRIESTIQTHLTLAEVQVFGIVTSPKSVGPMLRLSNCRQSSNYQGGHLCSAAIDGNTNQFWGQSTLATTNNEAHPWWEARTDSPVMIEKVRIFNRQDCCPERLGNFVIKVDGKVCAEYNSGPFSVWTFDCKRAGSLVSIESRIHTHLTLAEVQVFGSPPSNECFNNQENFVSSATSVTESGKPCQDWSVKTCSDSTKGISCHVPSQLVIDAGLTGNACRNPGDYLRDRPWCYTTTGTRWEYCSIPAC